MQCAANFCKQSMSYSRYFMHRENANIVDCTLNIAKTAWVERESVRQVRDVSPHSKHFHLNSPLKTTPCHPQGCSHNLAVISANICRYGSALRAQQREVVSRSRSLQIRWHKNTSHTSTGRVWNPGRTAQLLLFLYVFTRDAFYISRIKCSGLADIVGTALGSLSAEVRLNWNHCCRVSSGHLGDLDT